jgi:hypothetical protein
MTPIQFRATLAKAKLSQRGAARLFKKNERTTRRYAAGERPVPDDIADNLRKLAAGKITLQEIENAYAG